MPILNALVESMITLPGAVGAAVVDLESGRTLRKAGQIAADVLEVVGIANARFLRCKMGLVRDQYRQNIEDMIITLTDDYHLIRLVRRPGNKPRQFLYLVLNRSATNLGWSRLKLSQIETGVNQLGDAFALMDTECDDVLNIDHTRNRNNVLSGSDPNEELPAFMRTDVALKLLGVSLDNATFDDR